MANETSKSELIELLKTERARWEALLAEVGEARMEIAGVTGDWTVKDIVGHLTAWESRPVEWFRAARAGTAPEPPRWDNELDETQINAWIYESNRKRSLNDVLAESRDNFARLLEAVRAVSEEELTSRDKFVWLNGGSLREAIAGNTYEHYREHGDAIRAWLARQTA